MSRVINMRAAGVEWDYVTEVRGVRVPIRSPDAAEPVNNLDGASGLLGVAARLLRWARERVLGLSPKGQHRKAIAHAWPREHHALLDSLTTGELIEQYAALQQIGHDWRSRLNRAAADQIAAATLAAREAAPQTPTAAHAGAIPGAGLGPSVFSPGLRTFTPGSTFMGHPTGRNRSREMGPVSG